MIGRNVDTFDRGQHIPYTYSVQVVQCIYDLIELS